MPAQKTSESDSSLNKGAKKTKVEGASVPSFPNPTWTEEEHNLFAGFLNDVVEKAVFEVSIPEMNRILKGYAAAAGSSKKISGYIFDLQQSVVVSPKEGK